MVGELVHSLDFLETGKELFSCSLERNATLHFCKIVPLTPPKRTTSNQPFTNVSPLFATPNIVRRNVE